MRYTEIEQLRERHPAWSLLRANHAALVLGFLGRVFVERNVADLPASELVSELDDELYALNQHLGDARFPRSASAYLDEWASPERGWLRKFYQPGSDEPRYDISPVVEKTLLWVKELRGRDFVGTESRLNTVFELLRQMVFGTEEDPELRLAELRRRRAEIDDEIARVESGQVVFARLGQPGTATSSSPGPPASCCADFREVEEQLPPARPGAARADRRLDRLQGGPARRGSQQPQQHRRVRPGPQLPGLLRFFLLPAPGGAHRPPRPVAQITVAIPDRDDRLGRVHYDWIDASERTQATVRLLSEQLRRFLDDQVWLENRRVFDLLRSIETKALRLASNRRPPLSIELDERALVPLPTERPLYRRPMHARRQRQPSQGSDDSTRPPLTIQLRRPRRVGGAGCSARLGTANRSACRSCRRGPPGAGPGRADRLPLARTTRPAVVFDDERPGTVGWTATTGRHGVGGDTSGDLQSAEDGGSMNPAVGHLDHRRTCRRRWSPDEGTPVPGHPRAALGPRS